MSRRRDTADAGIATTIALLGMSLVLVAGTLVFFKIAHANDLRTRAQTGGDAAALGALEPLRDQAIDLALQGISPTGIGYWIIDAEPEVPARGYADQNGAALVGKVRLSGRLGRTARVSVATHECQLKRTRSLTDKERRDLADGRNVCTDREGRKGIGRTGKATAVGRLIVPDCDYPPIPGDGPGEGNPNFERLVCDGVQVWPNGDRTRVAKLFKLRLVAAEDPVAYTGGPDLDDLGPPGAGGPVGPLPPLPAGASDILKKIIAYAYAQLGKPYVWGATGPNAFDCSGIIYAAYRSAGVAIPRTTFGQWPFGMRIPQGSEQAGDLIFFDSGPGSGPNNPGHVALVVDPKKKLMVEARCTNCGPIRVNSYAGKGNVVGFTRPLARFNRT